MCWHLPSWDLTELNPADYKSTVLEFGLAVSCVRRQKAAALNVHNCLLANSTASKFIKSRKRCPIIIFRYCIEHKNIDTRTHISFQIPIKLPLNLYTGKVGVSYPVPSEHFPWPHNWEQTILLACKHNEELGQVPTKNIPWKPAFLTWRLECLMLSVKRNRRYWIHM